VTKIVASLAVREAILADASAIAVLITELGYPTTPAEMRGRLSGLLEDPGYVTFVAELDGSLVGVSGGAISRYFEKDGMYACLVALAVAAAHQGLGVGSALVDAVERWATAKGAVDIVVNSGSHRGEAHLFYKRQGYRITGVRLVKPLEAERSG
jgi:GNAT superfamily N-acetyltransferase